MDDDLFGGDCGASDQQVDNRDRSMLGSGAFGECTLDIGSKPEGFTFDWGIWQSGKSSVERVELAQVRDAA